MIKHSLWANWLIVLLILSSGCKTDLDTNAPYKQTAVIYGLLDFREPRQYIRIMKTYQNGDGDAYAYAKVTDSLYFKNITAKLVDLVSNTEYVLVKDNSIPMKPGVFANSSNTLYYTDHPLNKYTAYKLVVKDNESGMSWSASTYLVDTATWRSPTYSFKLPFEIKPTQYLSVNWETAKNAYLYDLVVRMHYTDYILNDQNQVIDSMQQILDWKAASNLPTPNLQGGDRMYASFSQDNFFSFLLANVPAKYNVKRRAYWVDYILYAGTEDLVTYIRINEPSFGVVQKSTQYTNIANGLGIFSSRSHSQINDIPVSDKMHSEMANSEKIKSLKFF